MDFRGEKRRNETHESTTDPDARLARKGDGKESKLSYSGNVMIENRHGMVGTRSWWKQTAQRSGMQRWSWRSGFPALGA